MKLDCGARRHLRLRSPPMRGRGLKLDAARDAGAVALSPPMRGRGLKRVRRGGRVSREGRPPCGGAD